MKCGICEIELESQSQDVVVIHRHCLDSLHLKVEQLEKENAFMLSILREHNSEIHGYDHRSHCIHCGSVLAQGHNENCELYKLLNRAAMSSTQALPEQEWKCPHCGSTKGTWFSRILPMGNFCEACGKCCDSGVDEAGEDLPPSTQEIK